MGENGEEYLDDIMAEAMSLHSKGIKATHDLQFKPHMCKADRVSCAS